MRHQLTDQVLKNSSGYIIGFISTGISTGYAGVQTIKDKNGYIKGVYDPRTNTTKNKNGHIIGTGNILVTLI